MPPGELTVNRGPYTKFNFVFRPVQKQPQKNGFDSQTSIKDFMKCFGRIHRNCMATLWQNVPKIGYKRLWIRKLLNWKEKNKKTFMVFQQFTHPRDTCENSSWQWWSQSGLWETEVRIQLNFDQTPHYLKRWKPTKHALESFKSAEHAAYFPEMHPMLKRFRLSDRFFNWNPHALQTGWYHGWMLKNRNSKITGPHVSRQLEWFMFVSIPSIIAWNHRKRGKTLHGSIGPSWFVRNRGANSTPFESNPTMLKNIEGLSNTVVFVYKQPGNPCL